ncbi:DUF885 domain-containing protein [Legionella tunisiensis]|uniref:DUF885 domain-containing protein n=1 Tax=Legionella tunisiensis TaxID=1034944 RepID=UPI000363D56C|nr:DUF885 domain-containing protein [Legionella tunisiensis]
MSQQFADLANDYEKSLFDYSPELGLFWGKSNVAHDRFMDASIDAYKQWVQKEDDFLSALYSMDEKALRGSSQYLTYLLLKETLEAKKASRICREELWDINPSFGWHNKMAIVAEKQPVGTAEYRQFALTRWQTFDKVVDNQIDNLKLGVSLGYTAPKPAVARVLAQLKIVLNSPIEASPYFDFARRDGDDAFKTQVTHLIKTTINPAIKKYVDYLENDYLPKARNEIGVMALPAGPACYQAKIKQETTLGLTPGEIHELGLQAIQKLSREVAEIGLKKYDTDDMTVIFQRAKEESENYFSTEQDILDYNVAALERAKAKVSDWFDLMPKTEGTLRPYPAHRARTGASGEYHPPNEDGAEPGVFYINTYEPEKRSRIDQEATLFHELIPGHHFQIALLYENKAIPTLNRYLFNAGFGEGWALYVERLADEMGLYQDDISRLGMLSNETLRAARLVVDTGIHAFHWSREKAVDYLKQHTALSENIIEGEVDRYIMMPGQATAYMLGKYEIERLRRLAKEQLGSRFDIRQFHNQVLKNGVVSLPILRAQIESWLEAKKRVNWQVQRTGGRV